MKKRKKIAVNPSISSDSHGADPPKIRTKGITLQLYRHIRPEIPAATIPLDVS